MSSEVDGSRDRGVSIGSALSLSDGIDTVGTRKAAAVEVVAFDGVGRGRGTCGGVLTRRVDGRGASSGPKPYFTARGALPLFVDASNLRCGVKAASPTDALHCQARQTRTRSDQWSRRIPQIPSPVKNPLIERSAVRRSSLQPRLLREPCRPRRACKTTKRKRCQRQAELTHGRYSRWRRRRRQKHERQIPRGSRKAVNHCTCPVCEKS